MKRIVSAIGALTVLGLFSIPASAGDYFYRVIRNNNHARHHDDLDHRAFHRELTHREAHRYPMSYREHGRLHDSLDHEAFHDSLEHRGAHRNHIYAPGYYTPSYRYTYGSGIGLRTRGLSLWFGF